MFWAILLTFVITVLGMLVAVLRDVLKRKIGENQHLTHENNNLRKQINDMRGQDQRRRERAAYDRGAYDARQTDTLYRSVLKKYSNGERVTVMMDGEDGGHNHE